jgi:progranulin
MEYWGFEAGEEQDWDDQRVGANLTLWTSFDPPVRPHDTWEGRPRLLRRLPGWSMFDKRAFQCPTGTFACTAIDRPDSCCSEGFVCQLVQETSSSQGDVGCCPNGQTCGNALATTCASGYTACPNNPGGGCCLPGYACYDVGCVQTNTATSLTTAAGPRTTTVTSYTTITPSVSSPTSVSTSLSSSRTTSISSITPVAPLISTVTRTVTITSSAIVPLTCSTGYRSCPATLGGGCCPTDRACGSANCPALTTSSATPEPPVRPTSLTTTVETTITTTTQSSSPSYPVTGCPTGFYACSAFHQGGCCQVGRNCDSTSCPAIASTEVVDGSTLTIAAPTGSGVTAVGTLPSGTCATGWATCAPSVGGGCCPSGYICGTASCSISPQATSSLGVAGGQVGKEAPSNSANTRSGGVGLWWSWKLLAFLSVSVALLQ